MKKVLMLASVPSMIGQFNIENIKILQEKGYQVSVACNLELNGTFDKNSLSDFKIKMDEMGVLLHQINFQRGIGNFRQNRETYKQLTHLLMTEKVDFIHCHSPIGGVIGRLAAKKLSIPVIYTAHGFQFFKGGPKKDWFLFYPVEKYLSKYTDILITINQEDYELAQNFKKPAVFKVPGVGISYEKYQQKISLDKREQLKIENDIPEDSIIMLSIGELSKRKNHIAAIKALSNLKQKNVYYLICGIGPEKDYLWQTAKKLGIQEKVKFLGYTQEINDYLSIANFSIFLSKREGLGLAGVEAMAAGLPLISTYLGGIKDYTEDGVTGFVVHNPDNVDEVTEAIEKMLKLEFDELEVIKKKNKEISKEYSKKKVNILMEKIYTDMERKIGYA